MMADRKGHSYDSMDSQNRQMTSNLSNKITQLKSLAFDIEMETKDHNRLLNSVDDDFDSSTGFLSGSMHRVNAMIGRGRSNHKIMCYISMVVVLVFILIFYGLRNIL